MNQGSGLKAIRLGKVGALLANVSAVAEWIPTDTRGSQTLAGWSWGEPLKQHSKV
jgi:hypothetical protein